MREDEIPIGRAKNLIGQKFGTLTVLYRTQNGSQRGVFWQCQCECGEKIIVRADRLKKQKSCGKCGAHPNKFIDISNQRFGKLVAKKPISKKGSGTVIWECKCDCGETVQVLGSSLRTGAVKSCGAPMCAGRIVDLTGQRFGKLTVISYSDYKNNSSHFAYWNCKCDCGNEVVVMGNNLRTGHTTSCGCVNSQGELLIINLLKSKDINYQTQKTFEDCRFMDTNALAKFDFYIDNTYLIEYDGIQHFKYKNTDWNTEEKFQKTQEHDKYKNQWCKENNIPLIRIPYTKLNTLCIEDLMLETTQFRVV